MDPYKILEIGRNASEEEIKQAYKKACQKHHPDKKDGSEVKFKEIQAAYELLTNTKKQPEHPFQRGFNPNFSNGGFANFQHLFPLHFTVNITLEEAYNGCSKQIKLPGTEQFTLNIPVGVCLTDSFGGVVAFSSGVKQNFMASIHLFPDPNFKIEGLNLHYTKEISLIEYYEGTKVLLKTLDGKTFTVKVSTERPNQVIKMSKKGYRQIKNGFEEIGDLFIEIKVKLPKLNTKQIEALKNIVQPLDVVI